MGPSSVNFRLSSGSSRILRKSSLILLVISGEVPGGAMRANHPMATKPMTVSVTVGTLPRLGKRSLEATAIGFSRPPGARRAGGGGAVEAPQRPPADDVEDRLRGAGIVNESQICARAAAEPFAGHMRQGAACRDRAREPARAR